MAPGLLTFSAWADVVLPCLGILLDLEGQPPRDTLIRQAAISPAEQELDDHEGQDEGHADIKHQASCSLIVGQNFR
jgi:hypothetical protein